MRKTFKELWSRLEDSHSDHTRRSAFYRRAVPLSEFNSIDPSKMLGERRHLQSFLKARREKMFCKEKKAGQLKSIVATSIKPEEKEFRTTYRISTKPKLERSAAPEQG
ncbi:hypothetical protein TNIN_497241 [Trichonephila inaurata madagascariensis]|uniref:Uncharacterized protein n=1 Tax=Trichonephila inaurata madagascariensis TaxID=2747483 RepID=A0A8X7BXL9_9ARAC|nr:hypothetical protein TNIN_497241 [Trichonephila inaurata madagascariensis]